MFPFYPANSIDIRYILNRGIFVTTEIPDLFALMFADDVSCFADTVVGLQRLLNELEIFCKSIGINVIFDKTKIVVHRNGGPLRLTEKWLPLFEGKNVEVVKNILVYYSHQS